MTDQLRYNEGKPQLSYWFSQTKTPERILAGANPAVIEVGKFLSLYLNGHDAALGSAIDELASIVGGPLALAEGFSRVCTTGAAKYARGNYRKGTSVCAYLDSGLRHLVKMVDGVTARDEESGRQHWEHLAWNLLMVLEMPPRRDNRLERLAE